MEVGVIESLQLIPHNRPMIETTEMNPDAANNPKKRYCRVASIGEIPTGAGRLVEVGGEEVALFNFDGEYYAVSDLCPHRGASLAEGFLDGGKVFCPWHCFDFNLKTGECATVPSLRVRIYEVKIAGEDIFVAC
jgi:nitrite reductase/ring-hydroxylating ferredoxin subunit